MIFVSIPYSDKDKSVVEFRVKTLCQYLAGLLKNGIPCISPITTGTTILANTDLPSDFEFWCKLSFDMLLVSTEMHVLTLDGWDESIGVHSEILFAQEHNIKITYINPNK